ncbi:DNA-binding protein NsdB [Kitasatospora sp. LaBMicrA B282]|uniref:DNA-binding protein NsdB n=1 Tax=Kitasatospora sp. LaBMicrA B282 TaxID=3420949 RepID=UPI003D10DFB7
MSSGPNTRLADLFALTGWSKGELARLVNRRGAAMGQQQLSTDTSRVRRWIERGEIPRDPVPRVLAAVFTERLGRVVSIEDLGLARPRRTATARAGDAAVEEPERTAEILTEFTGMDLMLNRRGLADTVTELPGASVIPDSLYHWLGGESVAHAANRPRQVITGTPARPIVDVYEPGPAGPAEVAALERSFEVFRAWDASRGGGLQRKAVIGQLNEVGGLLTHRHPPELARRLWLVAANLAALAGWMSHDVGLEATGQRYFVIAAQAAKEAGDRPRAGEAISRCARQLLHHGRATEALDLMRTAHAGAGPQLRPLTRAMLNTVEAWAEASLGHGERVARLLGEAEEEFLKGSAEPQPVWMQTFNEAELHGMQALVYRTLAEHDPRAAERSVEHVRAAIRLRAGQGQERSTVLDLVTLASVRWLTGEPEEAGRQTRLALELISATSSHRTWDRLRRMDRLAARYQALPAVAELRADVGAAVPAARRPPE